MHTYVHTCKRVLVVLCPSRKAQRKIRRAPSAVDGPLLTLPLSLGRAPTDFSLEKVGIKEPFCLLLLFSPSCLGKERKVKREFEWVWVWVWACVRKKGGGVREGGAGGVGEACVNKRDKVRGEPNFLDRGKKWWGEGGRERPILVSYELFMSRTLESCFV